MKILLLQRMIYVPTFGGANKANRLLLEAFAARGHRCRAFAPALGSHGPRTETSFFDMLKSRDLQAHRVDSDLCMFQQNGVEVHAIFSPSKIHAYVHECIREFEPDWILVSSEDPGQLLLGNALEIAANRTIYVVHTPLQLPFGPAAFLPSTAQAESLRRAAGIITVSRFVKDYIRQWGGLDSAVLRFPVYGPGPFADLSCFDKGFVTLVNPCAYKGISIFVELARRMPDIHFAAVPTWGTTTADETKLAAYDNIHILPAADDIRHVLRQTRVLLVPSLWTEALPLLPIEAMLHGIPVLASDAGGLAESKLGVEYILPVQPIRQYEPRFDEREYPIAIVPEQNIAPWESGLRRILGDPRHYKDVSARSRAAALDFVSQVRIERFEEFLAGCSSRALFSPHNTAANPQRSMVATVANDAPVDALAAKRRTLQQLRALALRKGDAGPPLRSP